MRFICAFFLITLVACNREPIGLPDAASTSIDVQNQPDWRTEPIDGSYVIQFPNNYTGGIRPTIEGPEFSLQKNDQSVYMLAPTTFSLANVPLPTPQPDSIVYVNTILNRTVTFRCNGQIQGIFYYAEQPYIRGQVYLRRNGKLTYSLIVQYNADQHREVLGILQTIQPR